MASNRSTDWAVKYRSKSGFILPRDWQVRGSLAGVTAGLGASLIQCCGSLRVPHRAFKKLGILCNSSQNPHVHRAGEASMRLLGEGGVRGGGSPSVIPVEGGPYDTPRDQSNTGGHLQQKIPRRQPLAVVSSSVMYSLYK